MAELIKTGTFNYQINQLVDENSYIVLHPETNADVVIESATRIFMKPEEREALANIPGLIAERLIFRGNYSTATEYKINDVVAYNDQLYICIENTTGDFVASKWFKVNQVADRALSADKALDADKLGGKVEAELEVAYAAEADQAANAAKLNNKEEKDLVVAEAGIATSYRIDENTTASIKDKLEALEDAIEGVQGGGSFTATDLTIKVEGKDDVVFNGKEAKTVEIKQNYGYADIAGLMKDGKIDASLLPDSIVGQLEYMGTWSAAIDGYVPAKGQYYIAAADVNVNPDGSEGSYNTGDWAVYNGTAWDKIDNTDAVTLVNGQKGAVEIYKGAYVADVQYYKGDIVKNDNKLYIAKANNKDAAFTADNWELFGRSYEGDNVVVVEGDKISHAKTNPTTTEAAEAISVTQSGEIVVPVVTANEYGHVTGIENKKYQLDVAGVDTVRPVKVNGTEILAANNKEALDLVDGNEWIKITNNNGVKVAHKELETAIGDLSVSVSDNLKFGSKFKVPSLVVDKAGHITSAELKEFTIDTTAVAHQHFEVVNVDGVQTIGAYSAATATPEWLAEATNVLKFYKGTEADTLKLNGKFAAIELYQGANKVVDASAKIYAGNGYNAETGKFDRALEGSFDAANNRFAMAETGVASGTYSAVYVNKQGLVTAGGQMVEVGTTKDADPSASLAVGGLFFRKLA
jgi:hypothetical protein